MAVADRLAELGIELVGYKPQAKYVGAVTAGDLVFVSGAGPAKPEGGFVMGKVGADLDVAAAADAARLCIISSLSALNAEIGDLERVKRIVKLLGFVNSVPGFTQQPSVIDGASELLVSLFGENGWHARSAVGVAELPFNIAVEIEMVVQIA
ncbi:MAG TPA: RidA family protein [Dehalococcoidia bacterium]|nr:RidA family protein [Dehalococcoidia bacterium]